MINQQKVRKTLKNSHLFSFQMYPNSVSSFFLSPEMFPPHPTSVHSIYHLWLSVRLNCNQQWLISDCWFRDVCLLNAGLLTCWKSHDFTCWQQIPSFYFASIAFRGYFITYNISPYKSRFLNLLNLNKWNIVVSSWGWISSFTSAHFQFA